jgi:hypothetical protein
MQIETDLLKHKYMIAMPCYAGQMAVKTALSLSDTIHNLTKRGIHHVTAVITNGTLIDTARNELADTFLNSDCDTLICIDADMVWEWDAIKRLMVYSGHNPIVVGSYPLKTDSPKFIVGLEDYTFTEDGLLPIKHAGFGFVAIQKQVFEKLAPVTISYHDKAKNKDFKAFFRIVIEDGLYVGEDVYFFHQAIKQGFQPMLDPMIVLGHVGTKVYDTPFHLALTEKLQSGELCQSLGET